MHVGSGPNVSSKGVSPYRVPSYTPQGARPHLIHKGPDPNTPLKGSDPIVSTKGGQTLSESSGVRNVDIQPYSEGHFKREQSHIFIG